MNPKKTFTAVLVTGATVAGVAGVLVLNPTTSSLVTAPTAAETGTAGGSGSIGGSGTGGSGTGLLQRVAGAREDHEKDEDGDHDEGHDDEGHDDSDHGGQALGSGATGGVTTTGSAAGSTGNGATGSTGATTSGNTTTGAAYQSPYGPMQVAITVSGNQVTGIQWVQLPGDGKSNRINTYAAPLLVEQGLQAQSATVDGVSGATYTTEGFRTSLASAISKAGL